jgi:hypothetical protein
MMPAAPDKEFRRDALLSRDGMLAAGIGTRDIAALVEAGEIVRVARNLYVRREGESHGWLDHAIACQISGGVLRGPTEGTIHDLTDDIPHAIHVLVLEGRRIKPRAAGADIRSRGTCQTRNLEIGVEGRRVDGFHLRVTDTAWTVVDLVRWGASGSTQSRPCGPTWPTSIGRIGSMRWQTSSATTS